MFVRIGVINRGQPALRLTRAVRELDAEHGSRTRVIALHREAERRATSAVAGCAVMRVDPGVVDVQDAHPSAVAEEPPAPAAPESRPASQQLREAFT